MRPPRAAAAAALVLLLGASRTASAGEPAPCLGPNVGRVLEGLVQAHAFDGVVPDGYTLERLDVKADHVEMGYDDAAGPAVTIVLAVPDAAGAPGVEARGPHFAHRLVEARGPVPASARDAMLRAALRVDQAIPAEEVRLCGPPPVDEEPPPRRAPKAWGLGVGAAECAIVLVALAMGLRRRRPPPPESG